MPRLKIPSFNEELARLKAKVENQERRIRELEIKLNVKREIKWW